MNNIPEDLFRLLFDSSAFFLFKISNDDKLAKEPTSEELKQRMEDILNDRAFRDRFINIMALLIASKKEFRIAGYMEEKHYEIALTIEKEKSPKKTVEHQLLSMKAPLVKPEKETCSEVIVISDVPPPVTTTPVPTTAIKRKRDDITISINLVEKEIKAPLSESSSMKPEEILLYWKIAVPFNLEYEIKRTCNHLELLGEREDDLAKCFRIGISTNKTTGFWFHKRDREDVVRYIHPDGKSLTIPKSSIIAIVHGENIGSLKELEKKCDAGCEYSFISLDDITDRSICIKNEHTSTDFGSKDYPFFIGFNTFCVAELKQEYKTIEIYREKGARHTRVEKKMAVPNVAVMERNDSVFIVTIQPIQQGDILFFEGKPEKRESTFKPGSLIIKK